MDESNHHLECEEPEFRNWKRRLLHRLSTKLLASNLAPPIVGRILKFNVASRLACFFIQTIYKYVCESVPLSGRQEAGED